MADPFERKAHPEASSSTPTCSYCRRELSESEVAAGDPLLCESCNKSHWVRQSVAEHGDAAQRPADPFEHGPQSSQAARPKGGPSAGVTLFVGVMALVGIIFAGTILLLLSSWLIGWPPPYEDDDGGTTAASQPVSGGARELPGYSESIQLNSLDLAHYFGQLGPLLQSPQIGDFDWEADVEMYADAIVTTCGTMTRQSPPSNLRNVHSAITEGCSEYSSSMSLLKRGISGRDTGLIDRALSAMQEGTRKMNLAADMLP